MRLIHRLALATISLVCANPALAAPIHPIEYQMQNGSSDPFSGTYHDDTYPSPNAALDFGSLSGGTGQLTDGVVAPGDWNQPGSGAYVGWNFFSPDIRFKFAPTDASRVIQSITFHVDDANGVGGVRAPMAFAINGTTYNVTDPAGFGPVSYTITDLNLLVRDLGDGILPIVIVRDDSSSWLFVSEIAFDDAAMVPEPGSLALLALGGMLLRRGGKRAAGVA